MKIEQLKAKSGTKWSKIDKNETSLKNSAQLVLVFGEKELLADQNFILELIKKYPKSTIISTSTSGEIIPDMVVDKSLFATAIAFEKTELSFAKVSLDSETNSFQAGEKLSMQIKSEINSSKLKHVLIFSDGQKVLGTDLIQGLYKNISKDVTISGGLAGDGTNFGTTLVGYNDKIESGQIIGIGFYGDSISIGCGSMGGWDSFGPERVITKSKGNTLFELDNKPALDLYKEYLGEKSKELPAAALLFPLSIRQKDSNEEAIVRTIASLNEEEKSISFFGDITQNALGRLMKANFSNLVDGASIAAQSSKDILGVEPELAILISCVGRKLVLGVKIDEEIESVRSILTPNTKICGFYSYGELAPSAIGFDCSLHNQTMTITLFSEKI